MPAYLVQANHFHLHGDIVTYDAEPEMLLVALKCRDAQTAVSLAVRLQALPGEMFDLTVDRLGDDHDQCWYVEDESGIQH